MTGLEIGLASAFAGGGGVLGFLIGGWDGNRLPWAAGLAVVGGIVGTVGALAIENGIVPIFNLVTNNNENNLTPDECRALAKPGDQIEFKKDDAGNLICIVIPVPAV